MRTLHLFRIQSGGNQGIHRSCLFGTSGKLRPNWVCVEIQAKLFNWRLAEVTRFASHLECLLSTEDRYLKILDPRIHVSKAYSCCLCWNIYIFINWRVYIFSQSMIKAYIHMMMSMKVKTMHTNFFSETESQDTGSKLPTRASRKAPARKTGVR